jgi:hypothetical protein
MEQEEWKKIEDTTYFVSNFGNIKNGTKGKNLKFNIKSGYAYITIQKSAKRVHRLVAFAFIENDEPEAKTQVNHIDGNKLNNNADNLEWIKPSDNVKHAIKTGLFKTQSRKVHQLDKKGKIINTYNSIAEASVATNVDNGTITKVCQRNGKNKSAGGYVWKYDDETILCKKDVGEDDPIVKIEGYSNYGVSKSGQIYSFTRKRYMNQYFTDGYNRVHMKNDHTGKRDSIVVHKVVAQTFIPNDKPNIKTEVNHINSIRDDNSVENLEWVTSSENVKHAKVRQQNAKKKSSKKVLVVIESELESD